MFRQPIHVGELVTFLASVNHTGTSSMEVGIKVAVDDDRRPIPVAPLQPVTEDGKRHFEQALLRKKLRQELEIRLTAIKAVN